MPLSCSQAQEKLQSLKSLKTDFNLAVAKFAASGKKEDADHATQIKETFDKAVKELQNELLRPGEFILKDIPEWDKLPNPEALKKDFKFDWVWEQEYRTNRPITDFEIQNKAEASSIAKVFDIEDIIHQKQQEDPNHKDTLATTEILEAIDKAGYRPATLEELLAYSRDHWEPNANPYIYGLNSVFSGASGIRDVPYLHWSVGQRKLSANVFESVWDADNRFLVLRKSSS